jgi:hypothetical protein
VQNYRTINDDNREFGNDVEGSIRDTIKDTNKGFAWKD